MTFHPGRVGRLHFKEDMFSLRRGLVRGRRKRAVLLERAGKKSNLDKSKAKSESSTKRPGDSGGGAIIGEIRR